MNKILKKRITALIIDCAIFGLCFVALQSAFRPYYDWWLDKLGSFGAFILLIPFFFKDLIFRNASLGKVIEGIAIYDDNWKRPKIFHLIKRALLMSTVGYVKAIKTAVSGGNMLVLFDWEMRVLKTRVIDKKTLKYMKSQINDREDYATQMSRMYSNYLNTGHITSSSDGY